METPNPNPEPTVAVDVPTVGNTRETVLAELEALGDDPETTSDPAPIGEEQVDDEGTDTSDTTEDEEGEGSGEVGDSEEESTGEPETGIDASKLAALQKAEKRQKEAASLRAQELDRREAALAENESAAKTLADLKARAAIDPVAVYRELGLTDELFEDTARDFWTNRPGAEQDRATTQRDVKQREVNDIARRALQEVESLKKQLEQKDVQQDLQARAKVYQDTAASFVDEDTPIAAKMLANNPDKFRDAINIAATKLYRETGETPDHLDVVLELENSKRAELLELGIEVPLTGGSPKQSAQSPKKSAGTLTNDLGTPTKTRTAPLSREELQADVLANLSTGNFET